MINILTLDLGTKTGWAFYKSGDIFSGTESFHNSRYSGGGMRFLKFNEWLQTMERSCSLNEGLNQIYFEEVRRHIGTDAAHVYGGFMAVLTSWCECAKIPYEGVPVGTIKKFITGKGNANKEEVMNAIRKRGHNPLDDNEADALALMYWRLSNEPV